MTIPYSLNKKAFVSFLLIINVFCYGQEGIPDTIQTKSIEKTVVNNAIIFITDGAIMSGEEYLSNAKIAVLAKKKNETNVKLLAQKKKRESHLKKISKKKSAPEYKPQFVITNKGSDSYFQIVITKIVSAIKFGNDYQLGITTFCENGPKIIFLQKSIIWQYYYKNTIKSGNLAFSIRPPPSNYL